MEKCGEKMVVGQVNGTKAIGIGIGTGVHEGAALAGIVVTGVGPDQTLTDCTRLLSLLRRSAGLGGDNEIILMGECESC